MQTATGRRKLTLEQGEVRKALAERALNSNRTTPTRPSEEVLRAFKDVQDQKSKEFRRQLALASQKIATMKAKRLEYLDEVNLLKQQTKAYESLDRTGAIPHNDVLEAERRITATETQLDGLNGNIREAEKPNLELKGNTKMAGWLL